MSLNNAHEGYNYQDLLTNYFILKEILSGNKKSIFSIDKKHTTGKYIVTTKDKNGKDKTVEKNIPDRFDDLVISDGSMIQRKQIKYSNDSVARKLIKNDFANDSKDLALYEIYKTWNELKSSNSEFRLCLAWDEPVDGDIKNVLKPIYDVEYSFQNYSTKLYKINLDNLWEENPEKFNRWDSLKKFVQANNIDRNDFKLFCDSLVIELELPKASLKFNAPSDLENILLAQAEKLGIGQYPNDDIYISDFLERLAQKVGEYRTRSAEITGEDILKDLRVKTDFGKIEQKFEIDQTKNIKSNEKYTLFQIQIITNKKTLLIGEPGSGKSWFLTNFIEYLNENSKKIIRHYCFTDTEDELIEKRVSSNVFFGNLIADIIQEFPKLQEIKDKLFVSSLDELNLLFSHIDKELIIIIDGLDHINRVLKNSSTLSEDKTMIIEFISQIVLPDNISIVLGSQPVEEIRNLIDNFGYIDHRLSKWNVEDTVELMNKYFLKDELLESKLLSEYLFEKSEGNPLYLTYIIKTLMNQRITIELINELPQYDFNLKKYYEYLTSQMDNNLTSEILSCLDFSININELENINPQSHHIEDDLKTLSPILNENFARGGMKLYHDSFRRYNIEKLEENSGLQNIYNLITKWLNKQGFYKSDKAYRYLLSYYIKIDKFKKVKKYATNDFLTKSLYHGYSESIIKINYDNFLYVAKETQDWSLFIYISELNRTMQSTLSDSYNEFEEKFELYFEAIGLIYGFEKANEILYFDGKQNFSDEKLAEAFYISELNGYYPNWKKLEKYFTDININNFKFYICYLIDTNKIDNFIDRRIYQLIEDGESDFFDIFIKEIYRKYGISKIIESVDLLKIDNINEISKNINDILFSINASKSLLIKQKVYSELEEFTLDIFNQDYYHENKLHELYRTLDKAAYQDINKLKEFVIKIEPSTFLEAWIKFSINIFIFEDDLSYGRIKTYKEFEKKLIDNFSTLQYYTSDTTQYFNHRFVIVEPILRTFKYIKSQWKELIDVFIILQKTPLEFAFIKTGLFDDFKCKENIKFLIKLNEENLKKDERSSEGYSFLTEGALHMLSFYSIANKPKKAKKEFKKAISYITAYTFRKDTTLSEIIEPLDSLSRVNQKFSLQYTKKLLPLNLTVQNHSEDGKGIRWLYIHWFEKFLQVDKQLASSFLINRFLYDSWFWKYEYMFIDFIQDNQKINPLILNFLYKLSPTNDKDDYINSFCDNIYKLIETDIHLSKQSLINVLERDINNISELLSDKTIKKLYVLKNILNVSIPIEKSNKEKETFSSFSEKRLDEKINEKLVFNKSLKTKSIDALIEFFEKRDRELNDKDIIFLIHYINEQDDEDITKRLLLPIIQKRFVAKKEYYEQLKFLIESIICSDKLKVRLLINNFVYSQGGWFENFINKESLKKAIEIDKKSSLELLSRELGRKFNKIYYYTQSTANLIIAFEYAGLKKQNILSMYKMGFECIEYRIPHSDIFEWKQVNDRNIETMSDDEIAIVMILVKIKNLDTSIQKEIIMAINYLFKYDDKLLVKPFKWFFEHIDYFPHVSIASLFELFLVYVDVKQDFFKLIKDDFTKVKSLENLYIEKSLEELIQRLEDV